MTKLATPAEAAAPSQAADYHQQGWWTGENLADRFERHVRSSPRQNAVIDDTGRALSRQELWERAASLGHELSGSGVKPGDAVVVYLPNRVEWQVSLLACLRLGAVPATLPITSDASTLSYVRRLIGARAIVTVQGHRRRPTAEWAKEAAAAGGQAATVLAFGDGEQSWTSIPGAEAASVVPAGIDQLMLTSSTTGSPKAVMHTADTLAAANLAFSQRFAVTEDTPIFMPSPLGHSVGAWHGARLALFTGAPLVLQEKWDPVRGLELIDEHRCEFTAAATPFLKDIVDAAWHGRTKLASLRTFLCGGAPVPPSLLEQSARQAPNTFATVLWGMTEGTGTTCTPESSRAQLTGTAGTPVPGLALTILDAGEDGIGELAMRGPGVFVGYLGQEETYRSLLTDDGFFRTGDLASIGDDGYLRLAGRAKDVIIRGGVNISPVPIEDAIAAHPAVRRVAVIGRTDERLGERICAAIVPDGRAPSLEELTAWLTERGLSRRNLPESLVVVEDMPVTPAGKIRKPDLRQLLEAQ
jgi:acyl-CoA synthetase (AMP-forming)/AMP-acid ligase II